MKIEKIKKHKEYVIFFGVVGVLAAVAIVYWQMDPKVMLESTYLIVESGKVILDKLV